jgi:hypothetical protein
MHELLVIDPNYINKTIPTLRLKPDLVGKRLYFWDGGTADDIAVLTHDRLKDTLRVSVFKAKDSGFEPIPKKVQEEMEKIIEANTLHINRFIYNMEEKELVYNLGEYKPIIWFYSYPPQKILLNKQYLVIWDEISVDGKTTNQKIFRLVQDTDNLVGLANFYNRSENFIVTGEPTKTGLNYSFLLTAHTFGLPLRVSNQTFLSQYCEKYKRGDNKLDPERIHVNFEDIALKAIDEEEEKKNSKKELIGGKEENSGNQSFSLNDIIEEVPSVSEAEIFLNNHSQKGFPVKISNAHLSGGFLVLYAEEDIDDYQVALRLFRTIFNFDRIVLIDLEDTEYEEFRPWLH